MRPIAEHERPLVEFMLSLANISCDIDSMQVSSMKDGDMGSLLFFPEDSRTRTATPSANATFSDADGMLVSVQLNVDQDGKPFELDLFKIDFSPLLKWPSKDEIHIDKAT